MPLRQRAFDVTIPRVVVARPGTTWVLWNVTLGAGSAGIRYFDTSIRCFSQAMCKVCRARNTNQSEWLAGPDIAAEIR